MRRLLVLVLCAIAPCTLAAGAPAQPGTPLPSASPAEWRERLAGWRQAQGLPAGALATAARLCGHADAGVRTAALELVLAHARAAASVLPLLQQHLETAEPDVRAVAVAAISRIASHLPRPTGVLREMLLHGDATSRQAALGDLPRLGDGVRPLLPALVTLVTTLPDHEAAQVLEALAKVGPGARDALPVLVEAAGGRQRRYTRAAALAALAAVAPQDPGLLPLLEESAGDAEDLVANRAAELLASLASQNALAREAIVRVYPALPSHHRQQIRNRLRELREHAVQFVPLLVMELEDPHTAPQALSQLEELGEAAAIAVPHVQAFLTSRRASFRRAALRTLTRITPGGTAACEAAAALAADPDPDVALASFATLLALRDLGASAARAAFAGLGHADARVRAAALLTAATVRRADQRLQLALLDRLADADPHVALLARRCVAVQRPTWVTEPTHRDLLPSPAVRGAAAALAAAEDGHLTALQELLEDPDPRCRAAALLAVRPGLAVGQRLLDAIGGALNSGDPQLVAGGLHAVAEMGPAARSLLERIVFTNFGGVRDGVALRKRAVLALELETGLLAWLADPQRAEPTIGLLGELGKDGTFATALVAAIAAGENRELARAALKALEGMGIPQAGLEAIRLDPAERKAIEDEVARHAAPADGSTDALLALAASERAYARALALRALGARGVRDGERDRVTQALVLGLGDASPTVAAAAAEVLAARGGLAGEALAHARVAAPALARMRASVLWHALHGQPAPLSLARAGVHDTVEAVRDRALALLGRARSAQALDALREYLAQAPPLLFAAACAHLEAGLADHNPRLRELAARYLAALVAARVRDLPAEDARRIAARCAAAARPVPRVRPVVTEKALERAGELAGLLRSTDDQELDSALAELGRLGAGARPAVPALVALATADERRCSRVLAVLANAGLAGVLALEQLALEGVHVEAVVAMLLGSQDLDALRAAQVVAQSLGLRGPEVVARAQDLVRDHDPERRSCGTALILMLAEHDPKLLPDVARLLVSDNAMIRRRCAALLGGRAAEHLPALVDALRDEDPQVRRAALEALAAGGPSARAAQAAVQEACADADAGVAAAARAAVAELLR